MDLMTALEALKASGSLVVQVQGRVYRLVVREGFVRLVIDETGDEPHPLDPEEAMEALREMVRLVQGGEGQVRVSPVEVVVQPLYKSILVGREDLLLLA